MVTKIYIIDSIVCLSEFGSYALGSTDFRTNTRIFVNKFALAEGVLAPCVSSNLTRLLIPFFWISEDLGGKRREENAVTCGALPLLRPIACPQHVMTTIVLKS